VKNPRCTDHGGRGCPCEFHVAHRRANSNWRRNNKRADIDQQRQRSSTCPRKSGAHRCGGRSETYIDRLGRTCVRCLLCVRREAGICRDCPSQVEGRIGSAIRCAVHKKAFRLQCSRRWVKNNAERVAAKNRARREDPAKREHIRELKRLWRLANPDKVRAQKQRHVERYAKDPNSTYNRYHKRYRTRHAGYDRVTRQQLRSAQPARVAEPCRKCGHATGWTPLPEVGGRPWTTCMECCWPCERRDRERRRQDAARKAAEKAATRKVRVPKQRAARGPGLERLCLTPGCDIVVTHRKKKCTRCRERDRRAAAEALSVVGGRGNRNDLGRVA
jgi:hypothetical protein